MAHRQALQGKQPIPGLQRGARPLQLAHCPSLNLHKVGRPAGCRAPTQRQRRNARTGTATPSAADQPVAAKPAADGGAAPPFSWTKQWYPVVAVADIDPKRPYAFTLLGEDIVLWRDGAGEWCCLTDRCPHRAAPLSEGLVWGDGTLACGYHGWRFAGDGACASIPQASSAEAEASARAQPRACARPHPVRAAQGLLWVWAESGAAAFQESSAVDPPLIAQLEALPEQERAKVKVQPWHRDLPYDWETAIENVIDPAHFPFAHHGTVGDRNKVAFGQYDLEGIDVPGGFGTLAPGLRMGQLTKLLPPARVEYSSPDRPDGSWLSFNVYVTPQRPGRCRMFISAAAVLAGRKQGLVFKLFGLLPRWWKHLSGFGSGLHVLDGDQVLACGQERRLVEDARRGGDAAADWRRAYYMPTRSDTLVRAFRSWLGGAAGGPFGPLAQAEGYVPAPAGRRELLDRYHQHTTGCSSCSKALRGVVFARAAAGVVAAAAALAALALGGTALAARVGLLPAAAAASWQPSALAGGAAALLALLWRQLARLEAAFHFVDVVQTA